MVKAGTGNVTPSVRVLYRTTWQQAFIHFSLDGGNNWSRLPGRQLESWKVPRWKCAVFASSSLVFVPHNGAGTWDHPASGKSKNYSIQQPGDYVLASGRLTRASQGEKLMLMLDLDGTLVGDDPAMTRFFDVWQRQLLPRGSFLVYNTGRCFKDFWPLAIEKGLLTPCVLIGSVGTEIHWYYGTRSTKGSSGELRTELPARDLEWEKHLAGDEWCRDKVHRAAEAVVASGKARWIPPWGQNAYKVTVEVRPADVKHIVATLKKDILHAQFIVSGCGEWRYLDIICLRGGKRNAGEYVMSKLGFSAGNTVACGDSGNDITMLDAENLAVVVGNAQEELRQWYEGLSEQQRDGRVTFTKGHHCADGILEGLRKFGFLE